VNIKSPSKFFFFNVPSLSRIIIHIKEREKVLLLKFSEEFLNSA
jgi:hypothetical protein